MSKLKFLAAFVLIFTAFNFTSCDNEPLDSAIDPNEGGETEEALFKADFDGQTFSTTTTMAYISGGSIIIGAYRSNGENFSMILDGTVAGTYPANDNLITYTPPGSEYGFIGSHPTDENADTGSVIITSINTTDRTISGTFTFTGYWSDESTTVAPKTFSNGVFTNIPYTTTNPTGDTFDATLNSLPFNDTDILTSEISVGGQDFISVAAENNAGQSITVSMRSNLTAGTYTITGNIATDVVQVNFKPESASFGTPATTGSVTIIEKTATRIKGTFTGTVVIGAVTYQITNGAFDVEY